MIEPGHDDGSTGLNMLLRVVRAEPGLSSLEIFDSLFDTEPADFASARAIDRALRECTTVVYEEGGRWFPGVAVSPAVVEPAPLPLDPTLGLEAELKRRLSGRRLIAEVGLDAPMYEQLTDAVEYLLRTRTVEAVARRYPFIFMTFMVGHGVYDYERGNFWGNLPVGRIDNSAGPLFLAKVRANGLEDFDSLVEADNATKYVTPILAHGGIPKYCLDDFFTVVIKDMQRVGATAEELLASWRTRKAAFFQVDKPVGRFLLYGGDLAVDLLDRCLAAIEDVRAHGRVPTPEEAGLPPYMLLGLLRHVDEIKAATPRLHSALDVLRPIMVLDPYAPFGPDLQLPPVRSEMSSTWRVWSAQGIADLPASSFESTSVTVPPARSWKLQLSRHNDADLEWTFEGFDDSPALFFDAKSGILLPPGRSIRAGSVWVLAPTDAKLEAVPAGSGSPTEPRVIEELADLSGAWTGYAARRVGLADVRSLTVTLDALIARRPIQPESGQPFVITKPIDRLRTDSGAVVFAEPPRLQLPTIEGMAPDQWKVRLSEGGRVHHLVPDDGLVVEMTPLRNRRVVPSAVLTARGPLGVDFRLPFALSSRLELSVPDRLLFPGDKHAVITLGGARLAVNGQEPGVLAELDASGSRAACQVVGPDGDTLELTADLPRLVWAPVRSASGALEYGDQAIVANSEDVESGVIDAVAIRTGAFNHALKLRLIIEGLTVQTSRTLWSRGPEGRCTFTLRDFLDTIRRRSGSLAEFVLFVGQRPVTVLRVRPPVGASGITSSGREVGEDICVDVRFTSDSPAKERVARFWSLYRPWECPFSARIPDGADGVEFTVEAAELPAGQYLLEVEVDDGWTKVVRPLAAADNTSVVTLGDPAGRWRELETGSAVDLLERGLATGKMARKLSPAELDAISIPAIEAVVLYVVQPQPGLPQPRGSRLLVGLLTLEVDRLARSVNEASARLALSPTAQARLALELIDRVAEEAVVTDDDAMRVLWATSPVLAARIDLASDLTNLASSRIRESLGWTPDDGAVALFAGEPIDQLFIGMPVDSLEGIRRAIDLVPKSILDQESLVAANFEWLMAAKTAATNMVVPFLHRWSRISLRHGVCSEAMAHHLAQREAPKGTEPWAGFPSLTLFAALSLVDRAVNDANARDLLWDAAEFAPAIVTRDLVLAFALHSLARQESP